MTLCAAWKYFPNILFTYYSQGRIIKLENMIAVYVHSFRLYKVKNFYNFPNFPQILTCIVYVLKYRSSRPEVFCKKGVL